MIPDQIVRVFSLIAIAVVTISCSRTENGPRSSVLVTEQPLTITATQSPTDGDSREPELTPTQNGVILSWVERIGEKRYALRTSVLESNGWTETRNIAEGENWFVNWADFPSVIALKDGTLAAHWLVKSGASTYA